MRDCELRGREVGVQIVQDREQPLRRFVTLGGERLDARPSHADECKLGGDKKSVRENKYDDEEYLENRGQDCRRFGSHTGFSNKNEKGQTSRVIHLRKV